MTTIISEHARAYAEEKYQQALPLLNGRAEEISAYVDRLTGDEKTLMKFLYGTMPVNDAGDYEPSVFYAYARHALFLREQVEWTGKLPEDVFLNYVFYYRVNNEDITDCRPWFYEMLRPVVEGRSEEEAVKEVNYWCARQASYESSDSRTLGPVGVFQSGSGRCGEESTFLVTALRSVGIAARQIYTPRWAHCDDIPAWVEAWVDGRWRFLGACEPEEVLDKGWFTNASSRAMMVHARVFSDYCCETKGQEEITERGGPVIYLNDTQNYAKVRRLTVSVKDSAGTLVSGAKVSFELLNEACYTSVSTLYTDGQGQAGLMLGMGSVHIHVSKGKLCGEMQLVNDGQIYGGTEASAEHTGGVDGETRAEIVLSEENWNQRLEKLKRDWECVDHVAPQDYPMHPGKLTKEQREAGKRRRQEANRLRLEKLEGFGSLREGETEPRALEILKLSFGNAPQIKRFLEKHPGKDALDLLSVLARKDYRDISCDLLEEHYVQGSLVKEYSLGTWLAGEEDGEGMFLKYVWNPRIGYERITPYRSFLNETLTKEQKEMFCRDPESVWKWIADSVSCEESRNYQSVVTSPAGVLRTGQGSELS